MSADAKKLAKKTARRKAARLALERAQQQLAKLVKPKKQMTSTESYVRAQVEANQKGDRRIRLTWRAALLGNPVTLPVMLDDIELVGFAEDPQEFGEYVASVGISTLAALTGVPLGPDTKMGDVLHGLVKLMGVDLEALKAAALAEESAATDNATSPGEETVQAPATTEQTSEEVPVL